MPNPKLNECRWCGGKFRYNSHTPIGRQEYCKPAHRLAAFRFRKKNPGVTVWGRTP